VSYRIRGTLPPSVAPDFWPLGYIRTTVALASFVIGWIGHMLYFCPFAVCTGPASVHPQLRLFLFCPGRARLPRGHWPHPGFLFLSVSFCFVSRRTGGQHRLFVISLSSSRRKESESPRTHLHPFWTVIRFYLQPGQ
jgi:hypothetical protein